MFTQNEIQEIINNYQNGESLSSLAKVNDCSTATIKKYLIQNNIHIRTRGEQTRLTNIKRAKYHNNADYFSCIDKCSKAWLIGFLAADGTVRKDENSIKIGLSATDKEILEKIKEEIKADNPIKEYVTSQGFEVVQLEWSSPQHKKDLAKYGVVPNKTYLENHLPHFDNDNYTLAYLLGYFDGDGSISVSKDGYVRIRYCCYREEFLQDVANFFYKKYGATYSISKDKNRQLYELSISTKYAIKIFDDMYNLDSIHLNRKYQKYLEYKSHETLTSFIR